MDFADQIQAVAGRISGKLANLNTEEATKNALVMPFISALGYNVFDPTEGGSGVYGGCYRQEGRKGRLCHHEGWQAHHTFRVQVVERKP